MIFLDVKCVLICTRRIILFGETSLVKPESLYAYYNATLIQRLNFLDICVSMCAFM